MNDVSELILLERLGLRFGHVSGTEMDVCVFSMIAAGRGNGDDTGNVLEVAVWCFGRIVREETMVNVDRCLDS